MPGPVIPLIGKATPALHIRKDGQVRMHQTAFFRKPKCI